MRHRRAGYKLQRDPAARRALLRGLVTNVIESERIITTVPKAKAGKYLVQIHYYSSHDWRTRSYCHVKVLLYVGTDKQVIKEFHVKLASDGQVAKIWEFTMPFSEQKKDKK